ncbi:MAG: hypothetical protein L0I76_25990 [Pseudonocardia sp.]|nr:hypothetical protein [Pseudonocardia sp.]
MWPPGGRSRRRVSDDRAADHLANKVLLLDGEFVTDLGQPAPPGTRIHVGNSL